MLRQHLYNFDLALGRYIPVKIPAYIQEQYLLGGSGVYTREEWRVARVSGYRDAGEDSKQLNSDESYISRLFTVHQRNVHATLRLARTFQFQKYKAVLELGCGEMPQAFVLKQCHPHLRIRATDYDPYIIEKCERLSILKCLEKAILDASTLEAEELLGFDLLISWEMIYALNDAQLKTIFQAAAAAKLPFLTCTTQLSGPLRRAFRALKNLNWRPSGFYYDRLVKSGRLRQHGWNPSVGYYKRLASTSGMKLSQVWQPSIAERQADSYSYLLFTPVYS